eukprot:gnl/TRDRNA2_/TRDRNA2_177207_c2_seq26.p1 gnl/TRDRNA2_/TRDRNA2_177207_c2~~gnl/TRDRNA2_/TRDRNA2_177207_c2_seq26.p1  ORF type:complete len:285 (+),score=15.36 gnl/TRDRNA2_/TRDRNA2_177207_c2_seq26:418-1272(+)
MAAQARQKEGSKWHPYLRMLPSLEEYRAKIPQYAEAPLLADFAELPVIKRNKKTGQALLDRSPHTQIIGSCLEALQSEGSPELQGLSVLDVALALRHVRERTFLNKDKLAALPPFLDLLNTAEAERLNTNMDFSTGNAILRTTRFVPEGHELLVGYDSALPNIGLLGNWGVYLEENSRSSKAWLKQLASNDAMYNVDCYAKVGRNVTGSSLKEVTDAALERRWEPYMVSPRCREEVMQSTDQGPLRCSLARVAWELCADIWYPKLHTLLEKTYKLIAERRHSEI